MAKIDKWRESAPYCICAIEKSRYKKSERNTGMLVYFLLLCLCALIGGAELLEIALGVTILIVLLLTAYNKVGKHSLKCAARKACLQMVNMFSGGIMGGL